jgi:hypothetical protein
MRQREPPHLAGTVKDVHQHVVVLVVHAFCNLAMASCHAMMSSYGGLVMSADIRKGW